MKLNSTQVKQTLNQFEAEVLPDNHPVVPQLHSIFGDHTFFLNGSGLSVLEPAETPEREVPAGEVASLASWSDGTSRLTDIVRRRCPPAMAPPLSASDVFLTVAIMSVTFLTEVGFFILIGMF